MLVVNNSRPVTVSNVLLRGMGLSVTQIVVSCLYPCVSTISILVLRHPRVSSCSNVVEEPVPYPLSLLGLLMFLVAP